MGSYNDIGEKRIFTLEESKELLSLLRRITATSDREYQRLMFQRNAVKESKAKEEIELEMNENFRCWVGKVSRLGCEPKGVWLVDFDYGSGFYCWHFPEPDILYRHGYSGGFRGREPLPS